jgi:hypothetical protein
MNRGYHQKNEFREIAKDLSFLPVWSMKIAPFNKNTPKTMQKTKKISKGDHDQCTANAIGLSLSLIHLQHQEKYENTMTATSTSRTSTASLPPRLRSANIALSHCQTRCHHRTVRNGKAKKENKLCFQTNRE